MKLTIPAIIFLYAVMNVALYIKNELSLVGSMSFPAYVNPSDLEFQFMSLNLTTRDLLIGGVVLSTGTVTGLILTGSFVYGGGLALLILALSFGVPVLKDVVTAFPQFLLMLGTPSIIVDGIVALIAILGFWWVLGLLTQREMDSF